ncbi:MMPL family transporter [Paenibacillus sp. BSR1-1]|uniref:MMPL family transporter n=1 Tax=Paenibacillus sp. BSR1-1 TaxID=3020845 RepID=UPI0025B0D271|nr:MMPL family transporter [Paenibacillus sp. BSR1-1]MDN3019869.1 MMPL family transporter [Paenibacillus sp. BSR1-1]
MMNPLQSLVKFSSSKRGAKVVLFIWIAAVILLSTLAPSSKQYSVSSKEGSVKNDTPSAIADQIIKQQFPSKEGLTGILVFHRAEKINDKDRQKIIEVSQWLSSTKKPSKIESSLPFHQFPKLLQDQMFSKDGTTLLLNFTLKEGTDSKDANEIIKAMNDKLKQLKLGSLQTEITGPAGISSDTISIFKNADFVLMLGTILLIFVLLLVIYRSPLLALTPLIIAAIVYQTVDRVLGFAGKQDWFVLDSSAISIMLVLLFAVLTDYSLFIFSRYREELKNYSSKYSAMEEAIHHVSEPILFSGGTVLLSVLTLFATVFMPYNHFAPVFSVAIVFILIAGLTLIPSIFALMGRKAFWPFIPSTDEKTKAGFWNKVSKQVMKHPAVITAILLIVLLAGALNTTSIQYSFNIMKSFPEELSSRQGFELLEKHYPAGQLAPVTVILTSDESMVLDEKFLKSVKTLEENLKAVNGVDSISQELTDANLKDRTKLPDGFIGENKRTFKLQLILKDNPYDKGALKTVQKLRNQTGKILSESGLATNSYHLHFAGQTAEQLDIRAMNQRDTIILFSLVTVLITFMLALQTRSILLPLLMMATILLSFAATLGFGWIFFHNILGFDSISYRLPVYAFVFMVALGVDYNIMLVSRIKEEALKFSWNQAVGNGVALTGGVISSAGIILAATFAVLMTQPLQELFLFGVTMALGVLMDTFLVRGMLLPSILLLVKKQGIPQEITYRF